MRIVPRVYGAMASRRRARKMELERKISPQEYDDLCCKNSTKAFLYEQCALTGDYYLSSEFRLGNIFPVRHNLRTISTIGDK